MELLLVFLSTAVGTVVGVGAAILMMNRRNRTPAVGDAAVRTQLQNTEWALASAARDVEDLRNQLVERDRLRDELERAQQKLAATVGDQERQTAERAAAETRAAELGEEVAALRAKLETGDGSAERVRELESALAAAQRGAAEISAQVAAENERRSAELDAALAAVQQRAAALSDELSALDSARGAAEQRANDAAAEVSSLRERVEQLTAEANAAGVRLGESDRRIACLEGEVEKLEAAVSAERERYGRAASEAAQAETLLRNERRAAVEAMELLSQAQDKFSGVVRDLGAVHSAADGLEFARRTNGHVEAVERA